MEKKFVLIVFLCALTFGFLRASNPASEVLLATALEPATTINLTATPLPDRLDPSYEGPAMTLGQSFSPPRLPSFRTSVRFEKTLFDLNLVAMAGLNIADYVSTRQALKYPGLHEANFLMKPFVKSPAAFAAVKLGTTVLAYWSFKILFKHSKTLAWIMTTATNCILSYVVANNIQMIQMARAR